MANVRPADLPAAGTVTADVAIMVDNEVTVDKATPLQIVDAARPLASQAEAEAGANNTKMMSPLRVKQAIDVLTALLATTSGAGSIGYDESGTYPVDTIGHALRYNFAITPADFAEALPGGIMGVDDTAAFVAMATSSFLTGRAMHIPDLGFEWKLQPDQFNPTPPASYNSLNKRPPAITADPSAVIRALSGGAWLVKLGTLASDYSGYLRNGDYQLPTMHDGGQVFTKAPFYVPFFLDCRFDYRVVCTKTPRGAWFGDTTAPAASAGVKGRRDLEWDFHDYARTVQSITNGVNPTVTFAAPHGLWPSSGNRVVSINFHTTPGSWSAIASQCLDCTILSSTQIQLKNVDTTAYGAMPSCTAYLNFSSSRVPKQIAGVTNANPAVVTTTTPHLLTSGETVDIAEILGMPTLIGQYTATVLTATTFSIPVNTTSTATWGAWSSTGPGWAMQWVPIADCDIGEYYDNATDIDDTELYSRHFRVHQYNNPATCGWDGKKNGGHFYNFPEAGEQLCAYYVGGDNNCVQVQVDGPFRYVFWAFGPRNASTQCSTNVYIAARDYYGALVRTESGAGWASYCDRLKSNSGATRLLTEHVGLGTFVCRDTIASNVAAAAIEFGPGNRAAEAVFDGTTLSLKSNFHIVGASVGRTPGGDLAGDYFIDFDRDVPLDCALDGAIVGPAGTTVTEDGTWGPRSLRVRRIRVTTHAGVAVDVTRVPATWRYPNA